MSPEFLLNGLILYTLLLVLLSFHEAGHAVAALWCGDDTAKRLGRVSLNPWTHADLVGTVILPLLMIFVGSKISGMPVLFGWAKPVPVDPSRLRSPGRDGVLIAMAGPAVNLILAALILPLSHVGEAFGWHLLAQIAGFGAFLSLLLCFFNLIPVPPLDGSHVLKYLTRMSDETYARFAQFGFIIVIVLIQFPMVQRILLGAVMGTFGWLAKLYGLPYG